jgi:hypothetical protein
MHLSSYLLASIIIIYFFIIIHYERAVELDLLVADVAVVLVLEAWDCEEVRR